MNQKELRIQRIFVKHFNQAYDENAADLVQLIGGSESLNFKPQKKTMFAAEIICELKRLTVCGTELRQSPRLSDLDVINL